MYYCHVLLHDQLNESGCKVVRDNRERIFLIADALSFLNF